MKATFTALKVWLSVAVVIVAFGCAKKDDGNNGGGYGYGGYPGGTGYNTGTGTPGQPMTATPVTASYRSSDGFIVDMELDFISTGAANTAQVSGSVRLSMSDTLCQVMWNPNQVMPIVQTASTVTITGNTIRRVKGNIAIQSPLNGAQIQVVLDDGTNMGLQLQERGSLPGPITGRPTSYNLMGRTMVQSGMCMNNPNLGWPLQ
jgi:hypothetical protein